MKIPIGILAILMLLAGITLKNLFGNKKSKPAKRCIVYKSACPSQVIAINTTVELFGYTVPAKAKLIATDFGNYIKTPKAWGNITWRIKSNGCGIGTFGDIKDQLGYPPELSILDGVELLGGDRLTVEVTNNYSASVECGFFLRYQIYER